MSAELETIERLFDAVHRNDAKTYSECFAENAEYKVANFPAAHGRAEIEAFGARIAPMFKQVTHDVKTTWQVGNTCISELTVAYHRHDGKVVEVPCLDFITVENGLVTSLHAYIDATPAFM